jgi:hypothetical protein
MVFFVDHENEIDTIAHVFSKLIIVVSELKKSSEVYQRIYTINYVI